MISEVHNIDCMEFMKDLTDKFFDLAIVDPPYGLGKKLAHAGNGKNAQSKFTNDFKAKNWDNEIPSNEYFDELKRISKNQIIWGGNYFPLPPTRCFICWDKMVYIPSMSRIEQAWTSFDKLPQLVQYNNNDSNRIHLTQKPVSLYKWILKNFANENDKIFDSHMGSQPSRIAAWEMGFDYWGCETDKDYFDDGCNRFENFKAQLKLNLI